MKGKSERQEIIKGKLSNVADKSEIGYIKIIITAIITAILTSITSYFLQSSKLSAEQQYWEKRFTIESLFKINNQRIQIIEEINKDILQLEVKAKEIKIKVAASNYYSTSEELKELTNLMVQYHKDFNFYAAKCQIASIYFDNKVDSLLQTLGRTLELNYQTNLLIKQNGIKLSEHDFNFETLDTLTNTRKALTKAMVEELLNPY